IPVHGVRRAHPPPRQMAVLIRGQNLHGPGEEHENGGNRREPRQAPIHGTLAKNEIEPRPGDRESGEERDLMMSAQPRETEKYSRKRGAGKRSVTPRGAQQK